MSSWPPPLHVLDEPHQVLFKQLLKGRHCGCTQLTEAQYHSALPNILETGSLWSHSDIDTPAAANQRVSPVETRHTQTAHQPDARHTSDNSQGDSPVATSHKATDDAQTTAHASIALTRIAIGHHTGVLVLGSPSPTRFNASLDTLFIDYLGQVVGRLLHGFGGR